jgi:hypothetical protein
VNELAGILRCVAQFFQKQKQNNFSFKLKFNYKKPRKNTRRK